MNLICYHGSPGLPQEFAGVERLLKNDFQNFVSRPRKGYPSYEHSEFKMDGLRMGYSWGSIDSMRDALTQSTRGLLLIAPYLFQKNSLSIIKKIVLSTPLLGKYLITKSAPKIVDRFLNISCDPNPVPREFESTASALKNPRVLKVAALEKNLTKTDIKELLRAIGGRKIPVAIIYGDQDKTSSPSEQIEPIKTILKPKFEYIIRGAGHAIPWTHPQELAKAIMKFKETL
jgi:pimeloyl-ACP methyl ester carboxylesterase